MKLLSETQCCYVGSSVEDTRTMAHTHTTTTMYHHAAAGLGFESSGSIISSSSDNIYNGDAPVPMMGAPSMAGNMNRKMLCQVCGALSSGLHFGVFTCEGCKCFYRRSIKEGANYACAKDRNCEITMETRNSCRYCRFQKCLSLGMSKEGIKLGRRPKVDSDAFQHGYYPPNDIDYHPHGYWPPMEQPPPMFKTEPVFSESDEQRGHLMYGDVGSGNYAMKPEPYTTCGQPPHGGHYGSQDTYGLPHGGQANVHFGEMDWTKSDRHLSIYHHTHMHPEMYSIQKCMEQHHSHGSQSQWSSELSPTTSGSGSEDNWDSNAAMHNRGIPSSVSHTLPEVQSGAAAAMAYANLYRGKNDVTSEKVTDSNCKDELTAQHQNTCKSHTSTSYTELVPRKQDCHDDTSDLSKGDQSGALYQKKDQSVALYQEPRSHTLHSPSRAGTGSTSPPHQTCTVNIEEGNTWLDTAPSPNKRKPSTPSGDKHGGKTRRLSSDYKSDDGGSRRICMTEHFHKIQELMDNYVPLEGVVTYQWETYQQSYGEQTYNDQPRHKDPAHINAFLKTHGEEVLYQIRKFASALPGFEELSQTEKDSLLHSTAPSIITTCLLHNETNNKDKHGNIYSARLDEGACFCAVILLMAGKKNMCLNNELCSKLGVILEAYISEKLSRRDPEKLHWLAEQLQQKMASH